MRGFVAIFCLIIILGPSSLVAQPDSCAAVTGQVVRVGYRSEIITTDMVYTVYLPPCYHADETTYPVLYLMHGSNDDDNHWLRLGLKESLDAGIASGDLPPVVVILPFGNWIANENRFEASWADVFVDELMPLVADTYRIDTTRRGIGGISRGGFWAFNIALRYPDLFETVGGHSAFFDQNHAPPDQNPLDLALTVNNPPRIYLDRGSDDFAAPGLDIMHRHLDSRAIHHIYRVRPGEHTNFYWAQHVDEYLAFYTEGWHNPTDSLQNAATPTAQPPSQGIALYLPVVSFTSLRTNLASADLDAVLSGEYDATLVMTQPDLDALAAHGVALHPDTAITENLQAALDRDKGRYSIVPFNALTPRTRSLWVDERHPVDYVAPLDGDPQPYPLAFDSGTLNFDPDRLTRVTLTGVTALTRNTIPALDANGVAWAAEAIAPYLARADFVHTSNEVSIVDTCPAFDGDLLGGANSFCSKPAHFELLTLLGIDIVELSGNHNNDYGYDAYRDTLDWYAERGIRTVGGGETQADARAPLTLDHNGNRVAWLACNTVGPYYALVSDSPDVLGGVRPGAAPCDRAWLTNTLPALATEYDLVILTVQYQEADQHPPLDMQRADFRQYAAWGADVVVGTQAHWTQPYDVVPGLDGDAFVHYGLGNFVFDQPFWGATRFTLNRLFIYDGTLVTVDVLPGIIEEAARPRPMTADERENFLFVIFNQYGE